MADEASDTLGGGLRKYIGALAIIPIGIGVQVLREGGPLWLSALLIAFGLPIFILPAVWRWITSAG
jgi:hypothetical protein